jgi:hypothetical protein
LKPNGVFIIVDFHPILWTFDDKFEYLAEYSYFNRGPSMIKLLFRDLLSHSFSFLVVEYTKGTYTDPNAPIEQKSIRWNHSLADIITSLMEHHLKIDLFQEFDSIPFNCFHNLCQSSDNGEYQFKEYKGKLPLSYAIKATKTNNK